MKFAVFKYADSMEEIKINGLVKKMPKKVLDYYIEKTNPYSFKEIQVYQAGGYEITLPLLFIEGDENYKRTERIVEDTVNKFKDMDVEIGVFPENGFFSNEIERSEGKIFSSFFIVPAVIKSLKLVGKNIKDAEILIIDGGNFITQLIIDCIYEDVNFLSIYTDRAQNFEEKIEEIYDETGLNVQVFSNNKNAFLTEADVIINAGMDLENYDYFFKSGSIYIDVAKNRQKLKRIMLKRDDMLFIDGIKFKTEYGFYTSELLEAAEYVKSSEFKNFVSTQYKKKVQMKLKEVFVNRGIEISAFLCNGKAIGEKEILNVINQKKE